MPIFPDANPAWPISISVEIVKNKIAIDDQIVHVEVLTNFSGYTIYNLA